MKQIKINSKDNVTVTLESEHNGHKIALENIKKGENVIHIPQKEMRYHKPKTVHLWAIAARTDASVSEMRFGL